jgi:hypothetical protein
MRSIGDTYSGANQRLPWGSPSLPLKIECARRRTLPAPVDARFRSVSWIIAPHAGPPPSAFVFTNLPPGLVCLRHRDTSGPKHYPAGCPVSNGIGGSGRRFPCYGPARRLAIGEASGLAVTSNRITQLAPLRVAGISGSPIACCTQKPPAGVRRSANPLRWRRSPRTIWCSLPGALRDRHAVDRGVDQIPPCVHRCARCRPAS